MLIEATVQVYGREMVQDLLKTEDIEGNTPLLLAVESGSPEIARCEIDGCKSIYTRVQ